MEDQAAADERIPHLLDTPAAIRFLSCEPLLGPINLMARGRHPRYDLMDGAIDWVIIGGESGPHAREVDPDWIRSLMYQCDDAGTAMFVKQLGTDLSILYNLNDRHGGDMSEWPPEFDGFRVREWPEVADMEVAR